MTDRPVETVHIPDGPVATETRHVPDGPLPTATQYVADLPRFGRFQTLAELGSGGMGTVYRAQDEVLGRAVAVKVLHPQADAGIRERFLREAKAIGAVLHPSILAIYDAGTDHVTPYLVMELASGGSLRDRIQGGPLPVDTVREIGIQIARGLAAAHAAKILHRDVKPANILSAQPSVWKLADFGIARLPDSTLTITGQFLGSPSYAAPESLRVGQFSPASDVYGLGATLYEALTGTPPHGDHEIGSLVRKLEEDPPPVHTRRAGISGPLGDAIMMALARDPAQRPSADEFARRLATSDDAKPVSVTRGRNRTLAFVALGAALVAIAMIIAAIRSRTGAQTDEAARPEPAAHHIDPPVHVPHAPQAAQPSQPSQPSDPSQPSNPSQPVDENGNPVDEDTARQMYEQMQRDAQEQADHMGRGRGRRKHHRDPWDVR